MEGKKGTGMKQGGTPGHEEEPAKGQKNRSISDLEALWGQVISPLRQMPMGGERFLRTSRWVSLRRAGVWARATWWSGGEGAGEAYAGIRKESVSRKGGRRWSVRAGSSPT